MYIYFAFAFYDILYIVLLFFLIAFRINCLSFSIVTWVKYGHGRCQLCIENLTNWHFVGIDKDFSSIVLCCNTQSWQWQQTICDGEDRFLVFFFSCGNSYKQCIGFAFSYMNDSCWHVHLGFEFEFYIV